MPLRRPSSCISTACGRLGARIAQSAITHQNNAFFVTGELGRGSTLNLDGLSVVERGIRGVLDHLGVLPAAALPPATAPIRRLVMEDLELQAFASRSGLFQPAFRLDDEVTAGELAGLIYDSASPLGEPLPVHFGNGSLAICIRLFTRVEPGNCLGHLTRDLCAPTAVPRPSLHAFRNRWG